MKSYDADLTVLERRHVTRDDCLIEAKISFADERKSEDCLIRNMSLMGAKIKIDEAISLPPEFFLLIPIFDDTNEIWHCELCWRIDDLAGIKFLYADI